MSECTTEQVLRKLGLEEPGLFCAYWSGNESTAKDLASELVAGGLDITVEALVLKPLAPKLCNLPLRQCLRAGSRFSPKL